MAFFGWFILKAGALIVLSIALFWPFQSSYQLFYSGVKGSEETTSLEHYLAIHGLFLFLVFSWIAYEIYVHLQRKSGFQVARILIKQRGRWRHFIRLFKRSVKGSEAASVIFFLGLILMAFLLLLQVVLRPNLIIFLITLLELLLALTFVWMTGGDRATVVRLFLVMVVGLAIAIGIGVDILTIQGDINRMNTVFKFYLQAWVLFGIVAGYVLWRLVWGREGGLISRKGIAPGFLRRFWALALLLLVFAALLYPLEATPMRARDRFAPLTSGSDGMAYMKSATYQDENGPVELKWDYDAIRWLQDSVEGSPVILEAHTPQYRRGGRVSVYTGLPTLIGFDWEQKQQRWAYAWMIDERMDDVRRIYTSQDVEETLALLGKYNVRYIYLGELERLYYPGPGLEKFDRMVGKELELAYTNEQVRIYRLSLAALTGY
jgi:uncharacterized membrane protein